MPLGPTISAAETSKTGLFSGIGRPYRVFFHRRFNSWLVKDLPLTVPRSPTSLPP
jgi:hypothetical protein